MVTPDVVAAIMQSTGYRRERVVNVLSAMGVVARAAISIGDTVRLPGLGTLHIKRAAARAGRNPRSGAPIQIEATKKVGFKPSSSLKAAAINGG